MQDLLLSISVNNECTKIMIFTCKFNVWGRNMLHIGTVIWSERKRLLLIIHESGFYDLPGWIHEYNSGGKKVMNCSTDWTSNLANIN